MNVRRASSRAFSTWAATVALIVVLFQALASGAMAHTVNDRGVTLIVCSAAGASTVVVDHDGQARVEKADGAQKDSAKTKAGLPCQDCVGAATAVAPPSPDPAAALVRYARQADIWRRVSDTVHKQARAPPRPPSRAPPTA
ncbi:MAG: DUF2946 family protein [Caulobacterales bacterium]|nr:DUF2946 family protein [Caulobacterales bacterium]